MELPTVKGWSLGRRRHYAFWGEELDGENPFCLSPSSLAFISDLVPESTSQMAEAEDQQPWGFAAAERGRLGPAHKPRRGCEWLRRRAGGGRGRERGCGWGPPELCLQYKVQRQFF